MTPGSNGPEPTAMCVVQRDVASGQTMGPTRFRRSSKAVRCTGVPVLRRERCVGLGNGSDAGATPGEVHLLVLSTNEPNLEKIRNKIMQARLVKYSGRLSS